jgi:hypothetical protein
MNESRFKIGDNVKDRTGTLGKVVDVLFSAAQGDYVYKLKPETGARIFTRAEDSLEFVKAEPEYNISVAIADNVVIFVMTDAYDDTEICRGHGHVIHEGAVGIMQAAFYAAQIAFEKIDKDGIYFKQKRNNQYFTK